MSGLNTSDRIFGMVNARAVLVLAVGSILAAVAHIAGWRDGESPVSWWFLGAGVTAVVAVATWKTPS